jgi:hypothetical protein
LPSDTVFEVRTAVIGRFTLVGSATESVHRALTLGDQWSPNLLFLFYLILSALTFQICNSENDFQFSKGHVRHVKIKIEISGYILWLLLLHGVHDLSKTENHSLSCKSEK